MPTRIHDTTPDSTLTSFNSRGNSPIRQDNIHKSNGTSTNNYWVALGAAAFGSYLAYQWLQSLASHRFTDQIVVITGGSRGLGLELARLFAEEGAQVVICARTHEDLERAIKILDDYKYPVIAIPCDITEKPQVNSFINTVAARFGRIDVLVNNAGIIQVGPLSTMRDGDFEKAMATHFWGPLYGIEAVFPFMVRQRGGRIVNVASIGGEISVPHLVPYCASKAALIGLSDGLRSELSQHGIQITTVCPGLMRTGSPRNAEFKGDHQAEYAWFSISDSLPLLSINSRSAARQIIEACRRGDSYLRISLPAKVGASLQKTFPSLSGELLKVVAKYLPSANSRGSDGKRGDESFSSWSPSSLTYLTEQAAQRNNEVR